MQITQGEWILNLQELAAVAAHYGLVSGPLSVLPELPANTPDAESIIRQFEGMGSDLAEINRRALGVLLSPAKVVHFNTSAGRVRASRSVLAYDAGFDGAWVCMAKAGELRHISIRSAGELLLLIGTHLAADTSIEADRVGADLSTHAALAFLACCSQVERASLISMLRHEEPMTLFSAEDIVARLQEASTPDFRWPLSFLSQLIPVPIEELAISTDPIPALAELLKAGLLETVGDGETPIFDFSEGGRVFSQGIGDTVSRVALSVTRVAPESVIAHDVMLFSRSSRNLLCFFMSGETAFISTLLAGDLDELLKVALAPPGEIVSPAPPIDEEESTESFTQEEMSRVAWLEVEGKTIPIEAEAIFGRNQTHEIIDDSTISRRHARFSLSPQGWTFTDLGSSNGSRLNGTPVRTALPLRSGDQLRLGSTTFIFRTAG